MFCVDKIEYEHLAILSNLKSCQFAPRIVIFNLCICCQFALCPPPCWKFLATPVMGERPPPPPPPPPPVTFRGKQKNCGPSVHYFFVVETVNIDQKGVESTTTTPPPPHGMMGSQVCVFFFRGGGGLEVVCWKLDIIQSNTCFILPYHDCFMQY